MAKKKAAKSQTTKTSTRRRTRKPGTDEAKKKHGSEAVAGTRPLWSGNLRLALVSVPVKLFPATKSGAQISFHQVHEPSGKRIRYQKVVPGLGPVDTDEIVKGFEVAKGSYVLLEPDEIDSLKIEAKKTLDLIQFVDQREVDPIWFDRPYYVVPDGDLAEEAYGVMRDALRGSGRIGLGQFVMRGREYVAAIKPCGSGLLLETLRFADEVRKAAPFFADVAEVSADKELLSLAKELIERKTAPFDPQRFKDNYTDALRDLIEAKRKHRKPVQVEEDEPREGAKIINLVDALKRSVKNAEKTTSAQKNGSRRQAS
jgi:DNA end-binding protein Ku